MKKVITLMLALVAAMAVNAKTVTTETTLWEGTDDGSDIKIAKSSLVKGATLNLTFNWLGTDGAQFSCFYWDGSDWNKFINWQWVNNGESYSFIIEDAVFEAIPSELCFKTEVPSKLLIAKITQSVTTTVDDPTYDEIVDLYADEAVATGDWINNVDLGWGKKGELENAMINDVIRVVFTLSGGEYPHVCIANADGWAAISKADVNDGGNYDFLISNATDLEKIQQKGILVRGKHIVISKVQLLKASNRYDAVAITIGEDGIATFSSSKHLDFSGTGITPYYASEVATGSVKLTAATTTWHWEGYILKGSEGTYTVPVTAEENASYPSPNYLKQQVGEGTVAASTSTTFHYIFAKKGSNIGFYKLTADHTLGAKKAYLETTEDIAPVSTARVSLVFDDDTTTGVELVAMPSQSAATSCYDLQGRQVKNPTKGLYIVNGKKVMVK